MIVRVATTGKRMQAYVSQGTVECGLCGKSIPAGTFYTRHQTTIGPTFWNREPRMITYCLCYAHVPFRQETEEEKNQATKPMKPVSRVEDLPTVVLPSIKPALRKVSKLWHMWG